MDLPEAAEPAAGPSTPARASLRRGPPPPPPAAAGIANGGGGGGGGGSRMMARRAVPASLGGHGRGRHGQPADGGGGVAGLTGLVQSAQALVRIRLSLCGCMSPPGTRKPPLLPPDKP